MDTMLRKTRDPSAWDVTFHDWIARVSLLSNMLVFTNSPIDIFTRVFACMSFAYLEAPYYPLKVPKLCRAEESRNLAC